MTRLIDFVSTMTEKRLVHRSNEAVRQDVTSYKSLYEDTATLNERKESSTKHW